MKLMQFAGALIAFALLGCVQAQQPIVVKFSHVVTEDTPKGKGAIRSKETCSSELLSGKHVGQIEYPRTCASSVAKHLGI
jgi:TRAP-type C4-dicarboxylate transport system substrate-binding protein